jgi:hypothetical protein
MDLRSFIATWLDPASVIVSLVLAVPVFWTWYDVVIGRHRRARQWFRQVSRDPGQRPAILIVDLLPGKDMRAQVQHYIAGCPELASIPEDRRFYLTRDTPLTPDDLPDLVRELRAKAADIARAGCDTVHCFYAGPVTFAAVIGAEFANGARLLFYQHHQGSYANWGPVRYLQY